MPASKKLAGLIVNPRAGLGGSVGLKGSDGEKIQEQALALGAVPHALERASQTLAFLQSLHPRPQFIAYPEEMGAQVTGALGFPTTVIGNIRTGHTSASDTRNAAKEITAQGVDLLLFAGGDGTARDIYDAIGTSIPALGIPAGVKIHSAVYANSPAAAGRLAALFLEDRITGCKEAEVMDIDEEALRQDLVSTRLYGYLKIPHDARYIQASKSPSPASEQTSALEIASAVIKEMENGVLYILGPGTTTRAITSLLGLEKTLIGVDVIFNKVLITKDANERELLNLLNQHPRAKAIITPIGGQGFLFGRGNQQISSTVIERVGRENIIVVSTVHKIVSLEGRPLFVDTGNPALDQSFQGYRKIITGHRESLVYRVASNS